MLRVATWLAQCCLLGAASLLVVGALSCSANVTGEWGAACSDGKDNDGDGLIDCGDSDCRDSPSCALKTDGRAADQRRLESGTSDQPGRSDQLLASSYGSRCTKLYAACPDGKTVCILGMAASSVGFCTYPCNGSNISSCPQAPAGLIAACVYAFNYKSYCAFLCRFMGTDYSCPSGLDCFDASYQKYCWPH